LIRGADIPVCQSDWQARKPAPLTARGRFNAWADAQGPCRARFEGRPRCVLEREPPALRPTSACSSGPRDLSADAADYLERLKKHSIVRELLHSATAALGSAIFAACGSRG